MFLYIFSDALTGEIQQPFLAHNNDEAIRISRMAFANVPHEILRDLYLANVTEYNLDTDPQFTLNPIFRGLDFLSELEDNND